MYKIKVTQTEINSKNPNTSAAAESFLQSPMWAEFKSRHGWRSLRFSVTVGNEGEETGEADEKSEKSGQNFSCSILVRSFAKNIFSLAYIPMMPLPFEKNDIIEETREISEFLCDFAKAIKKHLPKNTLCVRYDLPIDFATVDEREFFNTSVSMLALAERFPLRKTKVDIQPPDTVLLDLKKSEDEILAAMKSKWRYNVRLAQKKGVMVNAVRATDDAQKIDDALDVFYSLYKTTAERDGIAIHSKSYYRDLFALYAEYNAAPNTLTSECASAGGATDSASQCASASGEQVSLYTAYHENDALAAIITLFTKNEAVYLYGASSNVKRNMMPAYLLQWTAISDAKKFGASVYDFYGIPPTDDETHPMHGLYLFKTGFGGNEVHRPGSFDVPISPLYNFYVLAENARAFFFKKVKKLFRKK